MKLAIMQPYFFPYIGYFHLIKEVDYFVFLTDVQYTRRGWINRNRIQNSSYITVPVKKAHFKEQIQHIEIATNDWNLKHCKTFKHVYGEQINENSIYQLYKKLGCYKMLCPLLCKTIQEVTAYFEIKCNFLNSNNFPSSLKGKNRILDICKQLGASTYVNLPGGKSLYNEEEFEAAGINLQFIKMSQNTLSILDTCFNAHTNIIRF